MALRKRAFGLVTAGLLGLSLPQDLFAYDLSARTIYQQAKNSNYEYFQLLKRYRLAIDKVDNRGNTAYCMALAMHDDRTANFLAKEGANVNHQCVKRNQQLAKQAEPKPRKTYAERTMHHPEPVKESFSIDRDYLWYGLGVLALGGGIAALASGGGGGHGGGGGWNKHLPLTPAPDSDPMVRPTVPIGSLSDMTAEEFKTSEFLKTNGLNEIKAAEAYAHIYQKDEMENIFSHQANSASPLAMVKVGIIDTGIYTNRELAGKIIKAYDKNAYNEEISAWGYVDSQGKETYVLKNDSQYYAFQYFSGDAMLIKFSEDRLGMSESELSKVLDSLGIDISNMYLMNGGGGRYPGSDGSGLVFDNDSQSLSVSSWYEYVRSLSHGTHVAGLLPLIKMIKICMVLHLITLNFIR